MLSIEEKNLIDKEIEKFPAKKHACLDALLVVQKKRGYIDDDTLKLVAEYLSMSATELDGIATFYNLIYRKPVGKSVIRLCDSVSCYIMGYENIRNAIKKELSIDFGQTTPDQAFTLLNAQCLGACDKAPVMMINDETYKNLTVDTVRTIISACREDQNHEATSHRKHENGRSASHTHGIPSQNGVPGGS